MIGGFCDSIWTDSLNYLRLFESQFLCLIDYNGDTIYTVKVRSDSTGGSGTSNWFQSLQVFSDSTFIVAGIKENYTPQNYRDYDLIFRKYDLAGDTLWEKIISVQDTQLSWPRMIKTYDNNIIVVGSMKNLYSSSRFNGFVMKMDTSGNILWRKTYINPVHFDLRLDDVVETPDRGLMISGSDYHFTFANTFNYYPVLMKLDSSGNVIFQNIYSYCNFTVSAASLLITALNRTDDNRYVVSCPSGNTAPAHFKFNENGDTLWFRRITDFSLGNLTLTSKADTNGNVVAAGTTEDSIGHWLGMLYKLDSTGSLVWKRTFTYNNDLKDVRIEAITKCSDNGFLVAGETWCCNLVPNWGWSPSLYLYKTDSLGLLVPVGVQEHPPIENVLLSIPYPNPATTQTTFTILVPPSNTTGIVGEKGAQLLLFDIQGRQLQKHNLQTGLNTLTLDVSSLANGEYLCVLSLDGYNAGGKRVIVQH
ncbi:MAG: T9SS type A sorting domain-containing protein [Bacteroidia bacterium]|nr:T9SS type A sorting domain-containing protein [Bacteroidia bacterium]